MTNVKVANTYLEFTGDINLAMDKKVSPYISDEHFELTDAGFKVNFYIYDERGDEYGWGYIDVVGKFKDDDECLDFIEMYEQELLNTVLNLSEYKAIYGKVVAPSVAIDIRGAFVSSNNGSFDVLANDGVWYTVPSGYDFQEDVDSEVKRRACNALEHEERDADVEDLIEEILEVSPIVQSWYEEGLSLPEARDKVWDVLNRYMEGILIDKEWQLEVLNGIELDMSEWKACNA